MGLRVLNAAAREGKTEWAVRQALIQSAGLMNVPYILLPSKTQVDDFKQRMADRGGAMGVLLGTFSELSQSILDRSDRNLIIISEISQTRLLQSLLAKLPLTYYQGIKHKPGFTQAILANIRELEAGKIEPGVFLNAVNKIDQGGRLTELALIYGEYRKELLNNNWADPTTQVWIAAETLAESPDLCPNWNSMIVDGFDDFSPVQMDLIANLSRILPEVTVTVTGSDEESGRPLVHKRFNRLKEELAAEQKVEFLNLGEQDKHSGNDLFEKLEENLFNNSLEAPLEIRDEVKMVAVPDREYEVRSAFRWIKKLIRDNVIEPDQAAVIMRNLEPYRKIIHKVAHEYRLPVLIKGGLPLAENPAVAAILGLLELAKSGKDGLVWHDLISVWKSPYFDLSVLSSGTVTDNSRQLQLRESKQLSEIARWGRVIQGYEQWREAFDRLINLPSGDEGYVQGFSVPGYIPRGNSAELLWEKLNIFIGMITPPADGQAVEVYLQWIENLLGELNIDEQKAPGLNIYQRILEGEPVLVERDHQALKKLVEVFREQILSALMFDLGTTAFEAVVVDLESEIKRQSYRSAREDDCLIICADCTEVRGISYNVVALIGMAEGEFPGTIKEDPFLRDKDRTVLRDEFGLPLRSSTESAEAEFFYEAMTRASERMFITRPRIADNGTAWQPSPYWEELLRMINITPEMKTSRNGPALEESASRSEIFEVIGAAGGEQKKRLINEAQTQFPDYWQRLSIAERIINARSWKAAVHDLIYNGHLVHKSAELKARFPADHVWSPSRLENYRICPLNFFVNNLLGLEKQEPPQEGLDARQLGNIYHHILEDLYLEVGEDYDIRDLLSKLPDIAAKIFGEAPNREGFRETAWWHHTQSEIMTNIQHSLIVLEGLDVSYRFYRAEQKFGIRDDTAPQLDIEVKGKGTYHLRGLIDRIDKNDQGKLRIIDYKTSSPFGFDTQAVRDGKKLQLPLYALAAQDGLDLGDVQEGFYFHVRSAQPSSFKMSSFWNDGARGPEAAMKNAVLKGWQAVDSIHKGLFSPKPPGKGCPEYCPAVEFCWQYKRQIW